MHSRSLLALILSAVLLVGGAYAQATSPMTLAFSNGGQPIQGVTEQGGKQLVTVPEDLKGVQLDEGGPVVGAAGGTPNPALGGGTPSGPWNATWSVTDQATGDAVQDQSTTATAKPALPTPGTFEVHNGGAREVTPPPAQSGAAGGPPAPVAASAAANTTVKDVTAPNIEAVVTGEGATAGNKATVVEEPRNKPLPEKTVRVALDGPNFNEDIVGGTNTNFGSTASDVPARPSDEAIGTSGYNGNDFSKLPPNRNRFDIPPSMLKGKGLYLKQHERSRVKFQISDNHTRDPALPKLADGTPDWTALPHEWKVESNNPESVAIEKDASGFGGTLIFRKPNLDDPSVTYTLCFNAEDKSGNATELRIPVVVYPTAVKIDSLGRDSQKKD